jgi:hypothetical protein
MNELDKRRTTIYYLGAFDPTFRTPNWQIEGFNQVN